MNIKKNNWEFDDSVAKVFDDHVRQSVPLYDEINKTITKLSEWFLEDDTKFYDIGTSTGNLLKNMYHSTDKRIEYIGIDVSQDMLDMIESEYGFNLIKSDVLDVDLNNASVITSMLTLQFTPIKNRQKIINNIYKGLNKGGAFMFVEKVLSDCSRINHMWEGTYHDMKLENGLDEKHVIDKQKSIRGVMKPLTLQENKDMLVEAGFKEFEEFFKLGCFVGFIAIK